MHPAGEEFVCLLSGQVDLILEQGRVENTVQLSTSGSYVLVARGTWHTAIRPYTKFNVVYYSR